METFRVIQRSKEKREGIPKAGGMRILAKSAPTYERDCRKGRTLGAGTKKKKGKSVPSGGSAHHITERLDHLQKKRVEAAQEGG